LKLVHPISHRHAGTCPDAPREFGANCLNRSVSLNIPHPDPEESGRDSGQILCPAKTGHGFAKRVLACFTRLSKSGYFLAGRKDCRQTLILRMRRQKVKARTEARMERRRPSRQRASGRKNRGRSPLQSPMQRRATDLRRRYACARTYTPARPGRCPAGACCWAPERLAVAGLRSCPPDTLHPARSNRHWQRN